MSAKTFPHYLFLAGAIAAAIGSAVALKSQPALSVVSLAAILAASGLAGAALGLDWAKKTPAAKELRIFSAALGVLLSVIAWFFAGGPGEPFFLPFQVAGVAALVLGVAVPALIRPIHAVWTPPAEGLMWLLTRLALAVTYFLPVFMIGKAMRLAGKDPLDRGFDKEAATYWLSREEKRAATAEERFARYRRQF